MLHWSAAYLDGRTAARRGATAEITPQELLIRLDDGRALRWPWREIRQTQGFYAGEQVRLERGGDAPEVLLVDDQRFVSAVRRSVPRFAAGVHDPRRRRSRAWLTVGAAVAAAAVAALLYFHGIPALVTLATPWVPVAWEDRLGAAVTAHLVPDDKRCREPAGLAALDVVLVRLVSRAGAHPYTFRITVMDHPMVNAFAAPGGHLVVLRGLIERARTPEELAGVLAHEVQHVLHRHATRALLNRIGSGLLLVAVAGDVSGVMAYGLEGARELAALSYSRDAESEADTDGLRLLFDADLDPSGMVAFFEGLQKEEGALSDIARYARSHPAARERAASLRERLGAPKAWRPLLSDDQWRALRRVCAG